MDSVERLLSGATLGAIVAVVAFRRGMLSVAGAYGAATMGTAAVVAGWGHATALLAFFVPSVALTRWRAAHKARRTGAVTTPDRTRTAWQVLANGGVFTVAALGVSLAPQAERALAALGLGALAAATADTWATEVGTAIGGAPWSLRTRGPVAAGTSGAITLQGSLAALAGAAWLGTAARVAGFDGGLAIAACAGGVSGAWTDTLLGATLQERRRCPACAVDTEQRVHRCGQATEHTGGWPAMTNDVVNLTSTLAGGLVALALAPRP